jgi:hypothetical protein
MTNRFTKFAAAVAPAALLLAAGASPADAKVLLMGDGGWEVSFDGSVNGFATWTSEDDLSGGTAGLTHSLGLGAPLQQAHPDDAFRVRTGLLPAVWGMNVKAPTTGGLDMAARIGLYPNISNNGKNTFHNSADLDMREIFFTVDGSWGQVLVGKTLSQFMGKNILTDQTLFGVGGVGAVKQLGGTTLGRIGFGYPYPQFNARIQYTTPDMSGFKVGVGVYDPAQIRGCSDNGAAGVTGAGCVTASETSEPKFEGEASYAGSLFGTNVLGWLNGMYQNAKFNGHSAFGAGGSATIGDGSPSAANLALAAGNGISGKTVGDDINSWGFGAGLQVGIPVGPGTLTLLGSGYVGQALGLTFMQDMPAAAFGLEDAVDAIGNERDHWGFIGQAGYAFGQGTALGLSYGESNAGETNYDSLLKNGGVGVAATNAEIQKQQLYDVMLSHDINPNLKLVAEYGRQSIDWFDGADQNADIFSLGAFFFW